MQNHQAAAILPENLGLNDIQLQSTTYQKSNFDIPTTCWCQLNTKHQQAKAWGDLPKKLARAVGRKVSVAELLLASATLSRVRAYDDWLHKIKYSFWMELHDFYC